MQLLIAVVNQQEKLDEILSGLVELGVTGATILNSEGMGRLLTHEIPIFAGLAALASRSRPQNQTLFSVISEDDKVDAVIALLQEVPRWGWRGSRGSFPPIPLEFHPTDGWNHSCTRAVGVAVRRSAPMNSCPELRS